MFRLAFVWVALFLGLSQSYAYGIPCSVAVMGVRFNESAAEAITDQLNVVLKEKKTGYTAAVVESPGRASLYDYFMILQHNGPRIVYAVSYTLTAQVIFENSVVDDSRLTTPKAIINKIIRDFETDVIPQLGKCRK